MGFRIATLLVLFSVPSLFAFGEDPKHPPATTRIAVYSDVGTGKSINELLKVLEKADRLSIQKITAEDVRSEVLDGFDVVIHPGGSGSKQGKQLGEDGRQAVRSFVRHGGGFIGFCAGAYLASADYTWSLHILDAKVVDRKHWARGTGHVRVRLSDEGCTILNSESQSVNIYYGQGPLLAPSQNPDIPDFIPLGTYETEIAKNGAPTGVMAGTTAIAAGRFGRGRVFCFSPHPEKTEGLGPFVHRAIAWVTERPEPTVSACQPAEAGRCTSP